MPARSGLVVADDLSGATDTGHELAARGLSTTVVTGRSPPADDASVVVVNTDSRYAGPEEAADRVADAVDRYDAGLAYKKVDSTLRGNLVPEIDAFVAAAGSDLAVFAPAFPAMGRITVGGTHLVDGTPVARSPAGRDPDRPVADSHVPTLLDDAPFDVVHVPIDVVASGPSSVRGRFGAVADGPAGTVAVCDAAAPAHLASIAAGAADVDGRVTYVGSGGLAGHVRFGSPSMGGVLGVVGSASPRTFEQLSALEEGTVVDVEGPRAVERPDEAVEAVSNRAGDRLEAHGRAVVTAARSEDDVAATLEAGRAAGMSDGETREAVATVLGRCAGSIHRRCGVGGMYVTGGAVATAVLDALGGRGIRLTGHAVADGVPLGRIGGGVADGVPLVTKAGGFGEPDTIVKALDYLAQYDDGR